MDFPPILVLAIVWLLIGLPLSKLSKTAKQQAARNAKPGAAKPGAPKQAQPETPAAKPAPETSFRPAVMQPTITVTEHDDTVYQGSLNAVTGEGYDPCHDEQLTPLSAAETAMPAAEAAPPGLQLSFGSSEVVRGIVMSEILKRRA